MLKDVESPMEFLIVLLDFIVRCWKSSGKMGILESSSKKGWFSSHPLRFYLRKAVFIDTWDKLVDMHAPSSSHSQFKQIWIKAVLWSPCFFRPPIRLPTPQHASQVTKCSTSCRKALQPWAKLSASFYSCAVLWSPCFFRRPIRRPTPQHASQVTKCPTSGHKALSF